jgi:hypothetical protein
VNESITPLAAAVDREVARREALADAARAERAAIQAQTPPAGPGWNGLADALGNYFDAETRRLNQQRNGRCEGDG